MGAASPALTYKWVAPVDGSNVATEICRLQGAAADVEKVSVTEARMSPADAAYSGARKGE